MRWEEERFQKWDKKWLDRIAADISLLHSYTTVFHEVQVLLTHNPTEGTQRSPFREFVHDAYVALMVSSVRRQGKNEPDRLSLARLLAEINMAPTVLSRARFVSLHADKATGEAAWQTLITQHFAGRGQEHVDSYLVKQELETLRGKIRTVEVYADHYFSQRAQCGFQVKEIPHTELEESGDFLFALMNKYYVLFRATALPPSGIAPDWKEVFRTSEGIP
jgi:hypothetical protein